MGTSSLKCQSLQRPWVAGEMRECLGSLMSYISLLEARSDRGGASSGSERAPLRPVERCQNKQRRFLGLESIDPHRHIEVHNDVESHTLPPVLP